MTELAAATLRRWTCQTTRLHDAVRAASQLLNGGVAVTYSPQHCRMFRVAGDRLLDERGGDADASIYEARVFNDRGELRWWRDPEDSAGRGRAVYITEDASPALLLGQQSEPWHVMPSSESFRIDNQYVLWGEQMGLPGLLEGWSCVAESRIGSLIVPVGGLAPGERVKLPTFEYLGRDPGLAGAHGNVTVLDERLLGLERLPPPPPAKSPEGTER